VRTARSGTTVFRRWTPPSFARGFVSAADVSEPPANPPRGWRTVERISFYGTKPGPCRKFLQHDNVAFAKVLRNVPYEAVSALAGRALDELLLSGVPLPVTRGPVVRDLRLDRDQRSGPPGPEQLRWFEGSPFFATTESLVLDGSLALLARAHAVFAASQLRHMRLCTAMPGDAWSFTLSRTGARIELEAMWHRHDFSADGDGLVPVLATLPATALAGFALTSSYGRKRADLRGLDTAVRRALRRQTGLAQIALLED